MNPSLIEHNIKSIVKSQLLYCKNMKETYYNYLFNFVIFIFLFSTIASILYFRYKGHNEHEIKRKDNEKRNYILYNLRKFQNIKNNHITNIPVETYQFA